MENILTAFSLIFQPYVMMIIAISALYGLFVGSIPGLTATMATALLVTVTFFMDPVPALAAIVTMEAMAIFTGDIPGALVRIPGTPSSAAYVDESYALTQKGRAGFVLGVDVTGVQTRKMFSGIFKTLKRYKLNIARSGLIGTFVGILPDAGADIGAWIACSVSKKFSKEPEK